MSIRLMADVWRLDLPTIDKMILLIIADHANDEGTQAYPSQATMAAKASISIRTVQRSVNNLVNRGFIKVFKGAGGSADCRDDRRPHLYQINVGKLRGDILSGRQPVVDEATMTTSTGRQSRPMNHPIDSSNETSSFDAFWKIYPRKVGKQAAQKAFLKALKAATAEEILTGAKRYAEDPNRAASFTAHPTTWLNAGRWNDEPLPPRIKTAEERRLEELALAERRRQIEQEANERWKKELEERERNKAPMPQELRRLIRG